MARARKEVAHPVACIDCHDPRTMQLRVTRPGFRRHPRAKGRTGTPDYDVNRDATRPGDARLRLRPMPRGYCFSGPEKRLTYPWAKGLKADEILAYYEETGSRTGLTPRRAPPC